MPLEPEAGLMVKYQFEIDDETWDEWKNTVPRSKSLEQRIIELIEADAEGRVRPEGDDDDIAVSDSPEPEPREPEPEPIEDGTEAENVLRNLDLPGSGSKYETRVDAVLAFYKYLRERPGEPVEKGDFEDLVEDRGLDVGYSSFTSLWNNWVKSNSSQGRDSNTLAQLPGVEMDGDDYVFRGER